MKVSEGIAAECSGGMRRGSWTEDWIKERWERGWLRR